jgi:hypothetical protein
MSDFVSAALAVWPWWSGPLLVVWWVNLYENLPEDPAEDPLAVPRGLVVAFTILATFAWVVGFILWLLGRA